MQNQYFVKGLGFAQRQEPSETRSYGRIRKTPYSAYNNRSYNLNYRDLRIYNDKIKKLIAILNNAIKNQGANMFKYLSIYVQTRQQEEIRAQLKVISDGLFRLQHPIQLYNQRLKCLAFYRLTKQDGNAYLKKELRIEIASPQQPITHIVFKKWMQITYQSKCNRLIKQQQQNMVNFYKFLLNKIQTKQKTLKVWSFNKLRVTERKQLIIRLINNIALQQIRNNLYDCENASFSYFHRPHLLDKIIAFQKIKQFKYFNSNHHYFLLVFSNIINSKINSLRSLLISSIRIKELTDPYVPIEQLQQIDIELARQSVHCKLEHQKIVQRTLKQTNNRFIDGILEIIDYTKKKKLILAFNLLKINQNKLQNDNEVQDAIVKNLSILSGKLNQKIKTKSLKCQKLDITLKLEQLFRQNYKRERIILKQKFQTWINNISFPPQLLHDYEIRLKVLQNEKEAIISDIEQLEALNNELASSMHQVKKTFLSEDSNQNTENKSDQKQQIEIQKFDIVDNFNSEKLFFEYADFIKQKNVELKNQYLYEQQQFQEEKLKMEEELLVLEKQLNE